MSEPTQSQLWEQEKEESLLGHMQVDEPEEEDEEDEEDGEDYDNEDEEDEDFGEEG
jgi:hypothetical protein